MARAFEQKYPVVKVEIYRAANKELLAKITAENQAKRHLADTVESTMGLLNGLREAQILAPYISPFAEQYSAAARQSAGVGYNTKLIPANLVPRNFADLLRPEFKDKMGFANGDTGARMIAAMLKAKGMEYVKRLQTQ